MTDPKPIAALALCGLVLAACASDRPHRGDESRRHGAYGVAMAGPVIAPDVFLFLPYDADHDHRIDKAERDAAIAGAWKELAKARSTVRLTEIQEWLAGIEGAAAPPFNPLEFAPDDGDSVSRADFERALIRRFAALDKNGDGVLDISELVAVPKIERRAPGGRGEEGGMRRHRRGGEGGDWPG